MSNHIKRVYFRCSLIMKSFVCLSLFSCSRSGSVCWWYCADLSLCPSVSGCSFGCDVLLVKILSIWLRVCVETRLLSSHWNGHESGVEMSPCNVTTGAVAVCASNSHEVTGRCSPTFSSRETKVCVIFLETPLGLSRWQQQFPSRKYANMHSVQLWPSQTCNCKLTWNSPQS